MSVTRIAYRFAKSLLDFSTEKGTVETTVKDISYFLEVAKSEDFVQILKSPVVASEKKIEILKAVFSDKVSTETLTYFTNVVNKSREPYLVEIANDFIAQHKIQNKVTVAKVTSATELSNANLEAIKAKLLKSDATLETVELDVAIDPSLIGGFKIELDGKLYDATVSHKLESLKRNFFSNSIS